MDSRTIKDQTDTEQTDAVDAFTALVVAFAERRRPSSRDDPVEPPG